MTSSQEGWRPSGFLAVVALFIPWRSPPWLILLSGIFFAVMNSVPYRFSWIPFIPAVTLFTSAFLIAGYRPRAVIAAIRRGWLRSKDALIRILASLACFIGVQVFFYAFSFLAAGGQGVHAGQIKLQDVPVSLGRGTFLIAVWLLLGVPNQAHRIGLKKDGYAERILIRVMTAGACVAGGIYFFSEHLHSGPLRDVHSGPLVVGIVFAAVLVAPVCSSIERAIWQQGIAAVFSGKRLAESWRQMTAEVLRARDRLVQHGATPGSENALQAETTEQRAGSTGT